ncbi:peptidylprolyl isomerase [Faunimonas pinastri]|uniref:peptidylprolyl isomerase n=1 Tax=Faunimonas pinastri TaxID=1855383 RepID=UPI0015A55062|nr:peptidylprolyl isomerase [Faunimonas pinastri]
MSDALRRVATGWPGKAFVLLVATLFAGWGLIAVFIGHSAAIATVGGERVSARQFDYLLQQRTSRLSHLPGRPADLDPSDLSRQTLHELVTRAALADEAQRLRLGVSDDILGRFLAANPAFRGMTGSFDAGIFQSALGNAGLSSGDYFRALNSQLVTGQLTSAVLAGPSAPHLLADALYKYSKEERNLSYVLVGPAALAPFPDPDDSVLQAFLDSHKTAFEAPETRTCGLVVLDPDQLVKPQAISDEEVAAAYQARKTEFTRPERRSVQRIPFGSSAEAEAAIKSLRSGRSFEEIARDQGVSGPSLELGFIPKSGLDDPAIADAAFSAKANKPVLVPNGRFGPVVIRVTAIQPERVLPIAQATLRLRAQIARTKGRNMISELRGKIEAGEAAGQSLETIAQTLSLDYRVLGLQRDGSAPSGTPQDLPGGRDLVQAVFAAKPGDHPDPLRLRQSGYAFYEALMQQDKFVYYQVLSSTPAHQQGLTEAHDRVLTAWRQQENQKRVAERARQLLQQLASGRALDAVASEIGAEVKTADHLRRGSHPGELTPEAVSKGFIGPRGTVALANGPHPETRTLLRVDEVNWPEMADDPAEARAVNRQLAREIRADLLHVYRERLAEDRPVRLNQVAIDETAARIQSASALP